MPQSYEQLRISTLPILEESQSIFYVHQASIVLYHCTQYEQNPPIHLQDITTNIHNLPFLNWHKCNILAHSQGIFYIHQASMVVGHCTKYYEQNQHILLLDNVSQQTHIYEKCP